MHLTGTAPRVLAPLLLGLLAFAVRILPWPLVLRGERVQLLDPDAWYHMRRIVHALRNPPELLGFDPFLNFPHGARAIWPPLFDAAVAGISAPFVGGDAAEAERFAVWLPPALGALGVVVTFVWLRRHFGGRVAWIGSLFLSVLSGSSWYARIGVVDHHVAVALLGTCLLGAGMELVRAFERRRRVVPWLLVSSALCALLLNVWPGGLLHVALLEAGLAVYGLGRPERPEAARFALVLACQQGVAALALVLVGWPANDTGNPLSPTVLSGFQPLFLAAGAVAAGAAAALWHFGEAGARRAGRSAQALVLVLLTAAALGAVLPDLAPGLSDAWRWLGREEAFQGSVQESRPLLAPEGELNTRLSSLRLSRFALLLPAVGLLLAVRELRGRRRAAFLLLAVQTAGLAAAALLQARFFNSLAVPVAAFFGLALADAIAALPSLGGGRLTALAGRCGLAALALWLWWPVAEAYGPDLRNQLPALRGRPIVATPVDRYFQALFETCTWLREHTPSPGDAYAPDVVPSYGVLGHWQYGHAIQYVGERPAVVDNFGDDLGGDNYRLSFEYFGLSEARAVALLERLRVRYVLIRPLDVARGDLGPGSMIRRLADPDGGGLARHRLVFEREVLRRAEEEPRSHFRIFERVVGAEVVGRTAPRAAVDAVLPYTSPSGRRGTFRRRVRADGEGTYRLRLPYATRGGPGEMAVADAWELSAPGVPSRRVSVEERDVLEGGRVEGPSLTGAP